MFTISLVIRRTPVPPRQPRRAVSDEAIKKWLEAEAQIKADFYARFRAEAEIKAKIEAEVQRRCRERGCPNNPAAHRVEDQFEFSFFRHMTHPSPQDYPHPPDWAESFSSPSSPEKKKKEN